MKVIISGALHLEDPSQITEMIESARPHIEGALEEEGCIAYDWTEDHLVPGRLVIYEEWTSSETLEAHLQGHWYRDMGAHISKYPQKPSPQPPKKFRVEYEEFVYNEQGVATGVFSDGK